MNTIDPRSPLAMARFAAEHPDEAVRSTPGYAALSPADRLAVDALLDRGAGDLGPTVVGLLRTPGFLEMTEDGRHAIVAALGASPTTEAAGRLQLLAEDEGYSFLHGAEARSQAEAVVRGGAFPDAAELAHRSGAARPGHEPHGALQWAELGLHVVEGIEAAEMFHGTLGMAISAAGTVSGIAALPLAVVGGLHEIAKAHEAGERWRGAVQYGTGYVDQLEAEVRGEQPLGTLRGPTAEGAAQARTFWDTLEPAERVAFREAASDELFASLRRCVERITVGGQRSVH